MATKAQIEKDLKKLTSELTKVKTKKAKEFDPSTLEHGEARKIINSYISEYIVTEEFMIKVKSYAHQEIDNAVLGALKTITGIALGTAITLLVTLLITGKLN